MERTNIINWERKGELGILSISNGKENYLKSPDFIEFSDLKKWTSEKGLKGIIVTGVGRNFSAGADIDQLNKLAQNSTVLNERMNKGKQILDFIEDLNIPVIAAINGVCFGGGLEIALACHMRVASERALFAFPETNHGLIPGLGGTYRLTQMLGKKAFEIVMNGDLVNAANALELGLINHISQDKDSIDLAFNLLFKMVNDRSVEVIHSVMQAIRNSQKMKREDALKEETELFCKLAVNVKIHQQK